MKEQRLEENILFGDNVNVYRVILFRLHND